MKKGLLLIVAALAALIVAGSAQAATPTLVSVGQQARHPQATFGPLSGVDSLTVYIATKPDLASDGSFLQENIKDVDFLTDDEIASRSWLYESQLDPGLYYVMARASDFDCYQNPNCIDGFEHAHADGPEAGAKVSDKRSASELHRRRLPEHERVAARREAALPGSAGL